MKRMPSPKYEKETLLSGHGQEAGEWGLQVSLQVWHSTSSERGLKHSEDIYLAHWGGGIRM